ncbi:MAG: pyrroline-5-carboxylate reductase family protein, partial [Streptosporangiaceae bacterium]
MPGRQRPPLRPARPVSRSRRRGRTVRLRRVIAVLGAGKMGEALISGMLRAGVSPADVVAAVRREERARQLHDSHG